MKLHTNEFKRQSRVNGKRINTEINYGSNLIVKKDTNSLKFEFNSELFKTVMKKVTFDTNIEIPPLTWINPKFGYKVNDTYEMLDYGNYYINDKAEYSADKNSYIHTAYDSMIESMIPYDENSLNINYPITYGDLLAAIATKLGWFFTQTGFPNENTVVQRDLYIDLGLTYRDILNDLCPASMGNIIVTDNKEMKIIYPIETSDTIDKHYLDEDNINIGKKIGPVNALVLSRAEDGDTINRRDEASIITNDLQEIKIKDNILLSSEFREDFIDEMFNKIKGFEYYEFDIKTVGLAYYDVLDRITINLIGNNYSTVILNCDLTIEGGVEEQIYSPTLEESVTDYSTSEQTDKAKKMATIIAYKNKAEIELLAKKIVDVSSTTSGIGTIQFNNANPGGLYTFKVKGNMSLFFPAENQRGALATKSGLHKAGTVKASKYQMHTKPEYPSENLFSATSEIVISQDGKEDIVYSLPIGYLNEIGSISDEFVYQNGACSIIRRIGISPTGKLYILKNPKIENKPDMEILIPGGDSKLKFACFSNLRMEAVYLNENEYTDVFATHVEVSSSIKESADAINLEVAKKVGDNEIISKINMSPEEIKILAQRLKLEGLTTINGNFIVHLDGSIEAVNGVFKGDIFLPAGGKVIGGDGILGNLQFKSDGRFDNYDWLGFNSYAYPGSAPQYTYADISVEVDIPENFTITSAILTLYHTPVKWYSYPNEFDGYSRNLRLYKVSGTSNYQFFMTYGGDYATILSSGSLTEITNAFGSTSYNPTNTSGASVEIKKTTDIKGSLSVGRQKIVIRTTNSIPSDDTNAGQQTGMGYAILNVTGYMKTDE